MISDNTFLVRSLGSGEVRLSVSSRPTGDVCDMQRRLLSIAWVDMFMWQVVYAPGGVGLSHGIRVSVPQTYQLVASLFTFFKGWWEKGGRKVLRVNWLQFGLSRAIGRFTKFLRITQKLDSPQTDTRRRPRPDKGRLFVYSENVKVLQYHSTV